MSLFIWLVFGVVAGVIASLISSKKSFGNFLENVILSVLGAILGGLLSSLFFGGDIFRINLVSLSAAVASSLLLIFGPKFLLKNL